MTTTKILPLNENSTQEEIDLFFNSRYRGDEYNHTLLAKKFFMLTKNHELTEKLMSAVFDTCEKCHNAGKNCPCADPYF